jgi:AcrR family transcriptional regulator
VVNNVLDCSLMGQPAYTRLQVDERRRQLIDAGAVAFSRHAYEELSMREIAEAAGVSKALLYHYFPSKIDLFKAAVGEKAQELRSAIEPQGEGTPLEQLAASIDSYLAWIEQNVAVWAKLMQSATTLPEARELVEGFREQTMNTLLRELIAGRAPRPALRIAIRGWLGYMDAAILDWTGSKDLPREQLRDLLLTAFGASLLAAQQADPAVDLVGVA